MVKIRLTNTGAKKHPFYKIIAVDERRKIGGRPLEYIGYWNPITNQKVIDKKLLDKWVKNGAQITSSVSKLI